MKICNFGTYPNFFCFYIRDQISLRGYFVFKTNKRISSINSNNDCCCSFLKSWVIKQQKKLCVENVKKCFFIIIFSVQAFYFTQKQLFLRFRHLDILCLKAGFWNFEDIAFPYELRADRLSIKKGNKLGLSCAKLRTA